MTRPDGVEGGGAVARAYFAIQFSSRRVLESLDDAQRGRLLLAMMDYSENGIEPHDLDQSELIAFETARKWLDQGAAAYEERCRTSRRNGQKGGRPKKNPVGFSETQSVTNKKKNINKKENIAAVAATRACAREDAPDGAPPPLPEPERFFLENGFGRQLSPFIRQQLDDYRAAGMEDALLLYAMQEAVTNGSGWAYARAVLERCARENVHTLAENAQRRGPRPSGRNVPVSRETPGGGDFLAGAMDRPRRLKRKD